jgi:hypothetical protein
MLSPDGFESVGVKTVSVLGKMRGPRKLSNGPKCGWKSAGLSAARLFKEEIKLAKCDGWRRKSFEHRVE